MNEGPMDIDKAAPRSLPKNVTHATPYTADVEGHDAAAKAAILASLAFGSDIVDSDVYREGISGVSAADVAYAAQLAREELIPLRPR